MGEIDDCERHIFLKKAVVETFPDITDLHSDIIHTIMAAKLPSSYVRERGLHNIKIDIQFIIKISRFPI